MSKTLPFRIFLATTLMLAACLGGCPPPIDGGTVDVALPFLDVDGNFTFDGATTLPLDATDELKFSGEITGAGDIDIYELGRIETGDRLLVDVQRLSNNLDAVAAVDWRRLGHIHSD